MNKAQFLKIICERLKGLPREDIERSLEYYNEMIADHIEDGLSEEEAVAAMGSIDDVVAQILSEIPLKKIVREKTRPKKGFKAWEIVLLILGFPVWGSILISLLSAFFAVYVSLWAVVISLYAADFAIAVSGIGAIIGGIAALSMGRGLRCIALIGAGLILCGVAILFFFVCKYAAIGAVKLGKLFTLGIKRLFVGKGEVK